MLLKPPDFVLEVLNPLLELVTLLLQELDMVVGLSKLSFEVLGLFLGVM